MSKCLSEPPSSSKFLRFLRNVSPACTKGVPFLITLPKQGRIALVRLPFPTNDVVLNSPKQILVKGKPTPMGVVISGQHCEIRCQENEVFIFSRKSTNGTFVNNVKLENNKCKKLKNGDIIIFGPPQDENGYKYKSYA